MTRRATASTTTATARSDEDYAPQATACGVGACAATGVTLVCFGCVEDSCTAGTPAADDATCDGVDDDCDGETDEDYAPQATACGVGACAATGVTLVCCGCCGGQLHGGNASRG